MTDSGALRPVRGSEEIRTKRVDITLPSLTDGPSQQSSLLTHLGAKRVVNQRITQRTTIVQRPYNPTYRPPADPRPLGE